MFSKKQLLKGLLEGCILKVIFDTPSYGYEIYSKLVLYGFDDLQMGTVYPILLRLEKQDFVTVDFSYSSKGPVRKIYNITPEGEKYCEFFKDEWTRTETIINKIVKEKTANE